MEKKSFFITAGTIFGIVGILHLYRTFAEWTLIVESFEIPIWLSLLTGLLAIFLSYWAFKFSSK